MLVKMTPVGESGGINAPELIWSNPDISQSFIPSGTTRDISENSDGWISGKHLADYDALLVSTRYYTSARQDLDTYIIHYIPMYDISDIYPNYYRALLAVAPPSDNRFPSVLGGGRMISINNNIITINFCNVGEVYDIPIHIWGIKGELTV